MNLKKVVPDRWGDWEIRCSHCHRSVHHTKISANLEVPWDFWCDGCIEEKTKNEENK